LRCWRDGIIGRHSDVTMQLILVVISPAAFFGLAVLGRGGFEVFSPTRR